MTAMGALSGTAAGTAIKIAGLLLLIGILSAWTRVFHQRRGPKAVAAVTALLVAAALNQVVLIQQGWNAPASGLQEKVDRLPWAAMAAAQAVLAAGLALVTRDSLRYTRSHLSAAAVKETVDLLPAGIGIGEADGTPMLVNLKMHEFCRAVSGRPLTDVNAFWRRLCAYGEAQGGRQLVHCADGRTLLFDRDRLDINGRAFWQLTASDVTEQYRIIAELKDKNEALTALQHRFRALNAQASKMVMEQELLAARVAVHDELGQVLLMSRYYFDHPEDTDPEGLLRMLRQANNCFLREAEADESRDACTEALELAERIGVTVRLDGTLPTATETRQLLGRAMQECATNVIRHAGGTRLEVRLRQQAGALRVEIENDGAAPAGPIRESGGLLSLRRRVEAAGGTLRIESEPRFRLHLRLPENPQEMA